MKNIIFFGTGLLLFFRSGVLDYISTFISFVDLLLSSRHYEEKGKESERMNKTFSI
jgi:hypothetical protein